MNLLRNNLSILFAFFVIISSGGCYTLLNHPADVDQTDTGDFSRCGECHSSYHHPGPYDPFYTDPWWDYYVMPWWYDDVIVITEDGEVPSRRILHDRDIEYRDRGTGIIMPPHGIIPPKVPPKVQAGEDNEKESEPVDQTTIKRPLKEESKGDSKRDQGKKDLIKKEGGKKKAKDTGSDKEKGNKDN